MARRHSVRERFVAIAEEDKEERKEEATAPRKFYISWLRKDAAREFDADAAYNKWVEELLEQLRLIPVDSCHRPTTAVAMETNIVFDEEVEAGDQNETEWRNRRKNVTDYVFIATVPHIGKHLQLIAAQEFSVLQWMLELQKPGDCSEPRIWFIPLEALEPNWFPLQLNGKPPTDLNHYIWHLPIHSLTKSGNWMEEKQELDGIEYFPYTPKDVIAVRTRLLTHETTECQFCNELAKDRTTL